MVPDSGPPLWEAPSHTLAKQSLYRRYLQAWLPILSLGGFPELLIVDGFAGPGRYLGGEDGSPVVALKAVLDHTQISRVLANETRIQFLFIEERSDRFDLLSQEINRIQRPQQVRVDLRLGTFEDVWGAEMDKVEKTGRRLPPTLVLIDPFGPTGFPMRLIRRLAEHPTTELLINFAYQPLNQWFLSQENMHPQIDELFGRTDWRGGLSILDPFIKEKYFVEKYQEALAEPGWRGVAFQMINVFNQTQYYLIYGTKHHLGMRVFKDAAWHVAPNGKFQFSDLSNPNQIGFLRDVDTASTITSLAEALLDKYRGDVVAKRDLEEFADFHPTSRQPHLTQALKRLESANPPLIVEVTRPSGQSRRKGSFPSDCHVRFSALP